MPLILDPVMKQSNVNFNPKNLGFWLVEHEKIM